MYPRFLPLPLEVLGDIEYALRPASSLGFDNWGDLHLHIKLDMNSTWSVLNLLIIERNGTIIMVNQITTGENVVKNLRHMLVFCRGR